MTLDEYIASIRDKSVTVIGIGVSNIPLIHRLVSGGCRVSVRDKRELAELGDEGRQLAEMGVRLYLGADYLEGLGGDIIFRTPGLMPFESHLEAAKSAGSLITSEIELFFRLCPCKTVAVTGSDGKTTTTTIISQLLKKAGYTVHLGGNIGRPLLCDLPDIKKDDIAVLELSSFQLHSMLCSPDVAVITNLSPNHLDKHKDFQDYMDAKRSVFENQRPDAMLVLNLDDEHSGYYASLAKTRIRYFSDKTALDQGVFRSGGVIYRSHGGIKEAIMESKDILLPGEHNVLNYLAAFAATDAMVDNATCKSVAESFAGVEHRLEQVRVLRGVTYINDSIGTSPTRTRAGLMAMKVKPIVIAGGYDKHLPFDSLGDELCRRAKRVFLTGATAEKIKTAILASKYYDADKIEVALIDDFKAAVLAAADSAEEGDIVLFSPACAAFDRFKNFEERGRYFKDLIMELK